MPIRTCVGCGSRRPAAELIRVALAGERLVVDRAMSGRGAWLCAAHPGECARTATRRRRWSAAFRTEVPPALGERLETELLAETSPASR